MLIPGPPTEAQLVRELGVISRQYRDRFNPEEMQHDLDENAAPMFTWLLMEAGVPSDPEEAKRLSNSIRPVIVWHKELFNVERPWQLAARLGIPFDCDQLDTTATPSYPSGHTTQAFYTAHVLAARHPHLAGDLYELAHRISQSRIDRGVHYPADLLGGMMLAARLASWQF